MKKPLIYSLILLLLVLSGCSAKPEEQNQKVSDKKVELTISAAASLQDALNEITATFEKEHPNVKVNYNFGASGALAQQISQGAPVDLFFSAAEDKFDQLVQDGLIEESKGTDLVGNELVLVVPNDAKKEIKGFEDLTKSDKISIGTPEAVPAGQYAKETLENVNVWKAMEDKVVYAKDVRQVLTYVETNNVDAGIVYKTDALVSQKVKVVATAAEDTHAPIIYPLGVIKNSKHLKEAQLFYDYLQNETALKTFEKFGFKGVKE
ncbi:molybdate ABC transporter substrate-binding protein [Neobacillus sp. MER 74]|uniref:molybdate ABC transporter substrate-binding protein n=1 Tax=Neobacillus sp. MER 74 TaxID=2939566 RepID=UPI00203A7D89|nr:molybdate ABC transporter substrate-binding protein [Neobacillus sp. MER 74]MCM3116071.1 molybdate ABC transporter substrate-binding protein [Neobacillus sp. MER 74]